MLGYRERRQLKAQQQQQALGQQVQGEQRISLPAPRTMNSRDNALALPEGHSPLIEDMIPSDGGLKIMPRPISRAILASTTANTPGAFITYYGSGSASAEFWVQCGSDIHRLTDNINGAVVTASVDLSTVVNGDWVEFNKTIIYVTGEGPTAPKQWTRSGGWTNWGASVSAAVSIGVMWGVHAHKNRVYAWPRQGTEFYYGSVDQPLGILHQFDLAPVMTGHIRCVLTLPRDGGSGPDDYIAFISDIGDVVVYQGSNPGDANDWALVGTYKIGKPVGRNSHYTHINQTVVMCEDDFYFLPQDLYGEHKRSLAADFRGVETGRTTHVTNGVFHAKEGKVIFSDGSVLDPSRNWAYSTITLISAPPHRLRSNANDPHDSGATTLRASLGEFHGEVYSLKRYNPAAANSASLQIVDHIWGSNTNRAARVRTNVLPTRGRTVISLVNPIIGVEPRSSQSAGVPMGLTYFTGVEYDNYRRPYATASSDVLVASTASSQTDGQWTPGFGNGDDAQIYIETVTASAQRDIFLYSINLTASDTGGI